MSVIIKLVLILDLHLHFFLWEVVERMSKKSMGLVMVLCLVGTHNSHWQKEKERKQHKLLQLLKQCLEVHSDLTVTGYGMDVPTQWSFWTGRPWS